mmetsp:Transcript_111459/g.288151  ORF Transcript_111459/g.288151 Transcript_111459/m.288151 type:complete len:257 (-) Transcript_111459:1089-1859(-)
MVSPASFGAPTVNVLVPAMATLPFKVASPVLVLNVPLLPEASKLPAANVKSPAEMVSPVFFTSIAPCEVMVASWPVPLAPTTKSPYNVVWPAVPATPTVSVLVLDTVTSPPKVMAPVLVWKVPVLPEASKFPAFNSKPPSVTVRPPAFTSTLPYNVEVFSLVDAPTCRLPYKMVLPAVPAAPTVKVFVSATTTLPLKVFSPELVVKIPVPLATKSPACNVKPSASIVTPPVFTVVSPYSVDVADSPLPLAPTTRFP